jgi:hypothetical protein
MGEIGLIQQFIKQAKATNNPVGDMIHEMRGDRTLPSHFSSQASFRYYLISIGACSEAIVLIPGVWRRYLGWLERHHPEELAKLEPEPEPELEVDCCFDPVSGEWSATPRD